MLNDMESYYLDYKQLFFLLGGNGVYHLYGIGTEKVGNTNSEFASKENVYRIMVDLYQAGYIDWDHEMITMREPVKSIIMTMKMAEYCIECKNESGESIIYFHDNLFLQVILSPHDRDRILCRLFRKESFYQVTGLEDLIELSLYPTDRDLNKESGETRMKINLISNHDGNLIRQLTVVSDGIYTGLIIEEADRVSVVGLSSDNLEQYLFGRETL